MVSSPSSSVTPDNNTNDNNGVDKVVSEKARLKARLKEVKRQLRKEAKKEMKAILVGTFAMLCSTLSNQALPSLIAKVVDQSSGTTTSSSKASSASSLTSTSTSLALIVLGGGISSFLRTTTLARAQDNITTRIRAELFSKLMMDRELGWFQYQRHEDDGDLEGEEEIISPNSPTILNQILTDDILALSKTITTTLADTIRSTCSVVFSTFHMLNLNPQLFGLSVSIVPLVGGAAVILNKFVKKVTAKQHAITIKANDFAQERISKVSMVKLSSREALEVEAYCKLQRKAQELGRSVTLARGLYMGFIFTSTSGAIVSVFRAGGKSVRNGRMTHGELKSFVAYTFLLGLGTAGIMRGLGEMGRGYICAERVYTLINNDADDSEDRAVVDATTGKKTIPDQSNVNSISLSNVKFSYGNKNHVKNTPTINQVSLKIQRGQVVALVGKNGCGKSTLASLLVALYRPQSGEVRLHYDNSNDTQDFYSLDRQTQSSLIQLVPQSPTFFDMSIVDNVTYGNPNATAEEVERALALSNATKFVHNLKQQGSDGKGDGLNYKVGMNGCNLSAGQRQRLALARALLSDPPFLILDEPSTSLDAEGKVAVEEVVKNYRNDGHEGKRGLLLITHRKESLMLVDLIIVLRDGMIVEEGKYSELSGNRDSELCKLMDL